MRPHISLDVRNVPGSVEFCQKVFELKRMLEACCTIELDRRRGVTAYDVRDQQNHSCGGRSDCF